MAKFHFAVFLLFAVFAENIFGQAWVTYELDGKFGQQVGPYITEYLTKARADVRESERAKREIDRIPDLPPMNFTGTITRRSREEVIVIGVNATFTLTDMQFESEDDEFNRVKRDSDKTIRFVFYGQFKVDSNRRNGNDEVLAVKISLDLKHFSQLTTPLREGEEVKSGMEIGFKGKITSGNDPDRNPFLLDLSFGFDANRSRDPDFHEDTETNRQKRQSPENRKEVLNIDGELTIDETGWRGRHVVTVGVKGEASLQNVVAIETVSPKELFFAADDYTNQHYFETHGNVTGIYNGKEIFVLPFGASTRTTTEQVREKRNSPNELGSFGFEYDGVVTERYSLRTLVTYGISTKFDFWGISETRSSDEPNSNSK